MLKAPKFWYYKTDSFLSNSLYPFSLIFRLGTKIRNIISKEREAKLPIICVGNIVIGGAGKTPVALKIGNMLNVTVDFIAEVITCIKDKDKKIISGDPEKIKKIYDTWVFSRDITSLNPNWQLVNILT